MYRYAHTKNRVHRVIVEGGKAFKVEQCNLDDTAFFHLDDEEPTGIHCAYCWIGWVPPTKEEKAVEEKVEQREDAEKAALKQDAKPVSLVTSTRRVAAAAILAAAFAGTALGVAVSPDPTVASDSTPAIDDLRTRIEALLVEVRVLQVNVDGHTHDAPPPQDPVIVVIPTAPPADPTAPPTAEPSSSPSSSPQGAIDGRAGINGRDGNDGTTQVIIVTPPPATPGPVIDPHVNPTPTAQPTAVPTPQPTTQPTPSAKPSPSCVRPGNAYGTGDPCKFPHAP